MRVKQTVGGGVWLEKGPGRKPGEQQPKECPEYMKHNVGLLEFFRSALYEQLGLFCACIRAEADPQLNQKESSLLNSQYFGRTLGPIY